MHEDLKPTDLEYFTYRDKNLYKLARKCCCIDCFDILTEAADYLTFAPEDAAKRIAITLGDMG